jgi:hypothetical protein
MKQTSTIKKQTTKSKKQTPLTKKKSKFRLRAKNFFITFPQCSISKESALNGVLQLNLDLQAVVVVRENHADGTPHLHLAIFCRTPVDTDKPHFFDSIVGKHGNYQAMRSPRKTIIYIKKFDKEPLVFGIPPFDIYSDLEASKVSKSDTVAKKILSGSSLLDLMNEDPGYFMLNQSKIANFLSFFTLSTQREQLAPSKLPIRYSGHQLETQSIVDWLNTNLKCIKPFKSPQLWIHGTHNLNKTTLINKLQNYYLPYPMPMQEDFYDFYEDSRYDFCTLDEFYTHKTIQFLNLWLQGSMMNLRVKNGQRIKRHNVPTIICSNYHPTQCYRNPLYRVTLDALISRLLVIELREPIDVENIHFDPPDLLPNYTKLDVIDDSSDFLPERACCYCDDPLSEKDELDADYCSSCFLQLNESPQPLPTPPDASVLVIDDDIFIPECLGVNCDILFCTICDPINK